MNILVGLFSKSKKTVLFECLIGVYFYILEINILIIISNIITMTTFEINLWFPWWSKINAEQKYQVIRGNQIRIKKIVQTYSITQKAYLSHNYTTTRKNYTNAQPPKKTFNYIEENATIFHNSRKYTTTIPINIC